MRHALPGLTPPQEAAWRGYVSAHLLLNAHLERELMRRDGLSESDFCVLMTLLEVHEESLRFGDLRADLGWTKSRLSRQITRMESRGLVLKQHLDTDGRAVVVIMTEAGRDAILAAMPAYYQNVGRWFTNSLTNYQLKTIADVAVAVLARLPKDF